MGRLVYLGRCIAAQLKSERFSCPNCGSSGGGLVDRKYLVTQLRRCDQCKLMFRTPTDDPQSNAAFYEDEYSQGFTTDCPSEIELENLKRTNFVGTEKDYSYYVGVLSQLGLRPGAKLFDFGCSWGYGSYQLAKAGFEVAAFEVAPTRRRYAKEKLGVRVAQDMNQATTEFAGRLDCFFSAHVIEHVPSPAQTFDYAMQLLKPGGLFVSFTPNGCQASRSIYPQWSQLWGEVHPNYIDDVFLDKSFNQSARCIGSSPVSNASIETRDDRSLNRLNSLDGVELFFAARKSGDVWGH